MGRFAEQVYQTETDYYPQQFVLHTAEDFRYVALKKTGEGGRRRLRNGVLRRRHPLFAKPAMGLNPGTVVARVDLLQTKPLQNRMVSVKAADMERQIASTGRVALYGIYFDFNQATLKPESDSTLQEVQKLMTGDPNLKLLVVGHTDNVGTFEFNRDLSSRRAAAVVDAWVNAFRYPPNACSPSVAVSPALRLQIQPTRAGQRTGARS